jgi:hypothetical protein
MAPILIFASGPAQSAILRAKDRMRKHRKSCARRIVSRRKRVQSQSSGRCVTSRSWTISSVRRSHAEAADVWKIVRVEHGYAEDSNPAGDRVDGREACEQLLISSTGYDKTRRHELSPIAMSLYSRTYSC